MSSLSSLSFPSSRKENLSCLGIQTCSMCLYVRVSELLRCVANSRWTRFELRPSPPSCAYCDIASRRSAVQPSPAQLNPAQLGSTQLRPYPVKTSDHNIPITATRFPSRLTFFTATFCTACVAITCPSGYSCLKLGSFLRMLPNTDASAVVARNASVMRRRR